METIALSGNPGQTITLTIQTLDGYGTRQDGYAAPVVEFVRNPSGTNLTGFPLTMTSIGTGLFTASVTIPSGITAVGTYIASISWPHPTTSNTQYSLYVMNIHLPFGASSVSPV